MLTSQMQQTETESLKTRHVQENQNQIPPTVNSNNVKTLIGAIEENNQSEFFRLLNLKTDFFGKKFIDEMDADGASPLYWAAVCGHVHFITPLFKAGVDVNKPDKDGATPVLIAAQMGRAAAITALKAVGANLDTLANDGVTPIYIAAQNGHAATITALLEAGANVNVKTPWGTALECAKKGKEPEHKEVARLLEAHFRQYPSGIKPVKDMHQEVSFFNRSSSSLEQKTSFILTQYYQVAVPVPNIVSTQLKLPFTAYWNRDPRQTLKLSRFFIN